MIIITFSYGMSVSVKDWEDAVCILEQLASPNTALSAINKILIGKVLGGEK